MFLSTQELRSWEEELSRAALEQKNHEELLRRREQELAEREIDILERELNIIIHQLCQEKPKVKKRKGKFKKSRLKLKDGNIISLPSGTILVHMKFFKQKKYNGLYLIFIVQIKTQSFSCMNIFGNKTIKKLTGTLLAHRLE